jgi:hypothetical protein
VFFASVARDELKIKRAASASSAALTAQSENDSGNKKAVSVACAHGLKRVLTELYGQQAQYDTETPPMPAGLSRSRNSDRNVLFTIWSCAFAFRISLSIEIQEVQCHAEERSDEASLVGRKSRQAWVETVRSANARFARG